MKDKIIYIADINSFNNNGILTGHYQSVASMYNDILKDRANVQIAGGPIYKKYFSEDNLLVLPYDNLAKGRSRINNKIGTMFNTYELFKKAKGQTIVMQQCVELTMFLCILLFYRSSDLYIIQYNSSGINTWWKRLIFKAISSRIKGIICPNDELGKKFGIPYCVVPDYIYMPSQTPEILYSDKKYDFCIVGRIAPEKGVVEVAKYFAKTPYKLIIAGKTQTQELANELTSICKNADNITLILGYIDMDQYNQFINYSKFSILNYSSEYSDRSSGVVFDILFKSVPVIGRKCKTLQFIQDQKLGYIYDSLEQINFDSLLAQDSYTEIIDNIHQYQKENQSSVLRLKRFLKI